MKSKNWIVLLVVLVILLVVSLWIMSDSNEQSDTLVTEQESEAYFGRLRDKNDIYKMYDPTEVVTMYLTVSTGNEAENTNHTWAEINTYSAYDYEDMGIDRYKVQGLLQVGTEDGPGEGELGYGQMSPNCTVQIRGQISSKGAQKNYKIKIKDNKGDWRGQTTIA
ncbi:MAG: spore coat protein CotH, partial [Clostridia bacterium]|nr:spore coat protein CotH [Clostridia bacterium]